MKPVKYFVNQARRGRPDLAARNLFSHCGLRNKVRLLKIIMKHPHESGYHFTAAEMVAFYKSGKEM